tara:strand:+ start:2857 stop:3711 length:855 start_codon:yes stop_codon:yes gene_type:complete
MKSLIIHIDCSDQIGIIFSFTKVLKEFSANIVNLEQHVEPNDKHFFMRIHAEIPNKIKEDTFIIEKLKDIAKDLGATVKFYDPEVLQRVAILTTKEAVPLYDLLIKQKSKELMCKIPILISNHEIHGKIAEQFNIPFHYLPVTKESKSKQEKDILDLCENHKIDLIILARYMQILSDNFVNKYYGRIINIHHGFLPAFKGGLPYHQAWNRGVKIIGATAHYVTSDLDEGPIIEQDVSRVDHKQSIKDLIQVGREIERRVLTSAVKSHLEHRIILNKNRTIIFHS